MSGIGAIASICDSLKNPTCVAVSGRFIHFLAHNVDGFLQGRAVWNWAKSQNSSLDCMLFDYSGHGESGGQLADCKCATCTLARCPPYTQLYTTTSTHHKNTCRYDTGVAGGVNRDRIQGHTGAPGASDSPDCFRLAASHPHCAYV